VYEQLHLLRRCGPLLVGLCLDRSSAPDIYTPTFHVHCLLREFPTVSLTLFLRIQSANGCDDYVKLISHVKRLEEHVARMKKLAPLPLEGDVALRQYERAVRNWLKYIQSPYWPDLLEDRILIRAWLGAEYETTLDEAASEISSWPSHVLAKMDPLDVWYQRIKARAEDRAGLQRTLESEIEKHRVSKLPVGQFLP
jgi:hypothetical protein